MNNQTHTTDTVLDEDSLSEPLLSEALLNENFLGERYEGVVMPPKQTKGFTFNHTMVRIKDPSISLHFYSNVLGMTVLRKLDFEEFEFSLYFLARLKPNETLSADTRERTEYAFSREGVLELTHNWGSENDDTCLYHSGNEEPKGFGHICFHVPDFDRAIEWFDDCDVEYVKRPEDGKMNNIAFIKDPDGYWIEIIEAQKMTVFA